MTSLFLRLSDYNGKSLNRSGQYESTATLNNNVDPGNTQLLEIMAYSCDIEQTLNLGSQSTGAGAGKVTFNPFSVSRRVDAISPMLFQASAAGTPFKTVELFVVNQANMVMVKYFFKLVAVKTISWANGDEGMMEQLTFEYGGLLMTVNQQMPDGRISAGSPAGWNRVKNIKDNDPALAVN